MRGSIVREVTWEVDGTEVGRVKSSNDKLTVKSSDGARGTVVVRFSSLGRPLRATLVPADDAADLLAAAGVGGTDLVPEPGSPAAVHEERLLAHPRRYTALRTAAGVAAVVVPLLVAALLARLAVMVPWPDIPWPDLPNLPDLPDVPWPDLPDLPNLPWPDWSLPGWVRQVLDYAQYVWPVALAFLLARGEVTRRRRQAEAREEQRRRAAER